MRRTTCSERSEEQSKGYFSIYQQGRSLMSRDGESGSTTFGSMAAQWADTRCPAGASLERGL